MEYLVTAALLAGAFFAGVEVESRRHIRLLRRGVYPQIVNTQPPTLAELGTTYAWRR